ncbi:MAG: polysaccharide export protein [Alphaproteobacteria bacterium]|nr:polysaccharide export protein [Alphaproteobacteria bacterium]
MGVLPHQYFRRFLGLALVLLSCSLCACALPMAADIDAPEHIDPNQSALLASGDKIKLTIYGEEDISGEYMLDQRGILTLPMIGELPARGLTQAQLKDLMRESFMKGGYLSRPLISVDVSALRAIYVLGEVKSAGGYPFEPSLTTLKAVALAGGYTPRASEGDFLIDRLQEGGQIVRMNGGDTTPLLPGDTIIIRERIF